MTNLSSNSKIALFSSQRKFNQAHMTIENILLETTLLLHKTISIYKRKLNFINNLKLITTETFGDLQCNFYRNMIDNILARQQIDIAFIREY